MGLSSSKSCNLADHALVAKLRSKATGKALLQALVTTLFRHLDDPSPNVAHCVTNAILDEAGVDYWAIVECLGDAVGEAKPLGVNSPEEMCAWVERNMPGIAGRVVEDLRTAARHG